MQKVKPTGMLVQTFQTNLLRKHAPGALAKCLFTLSVRCAQQVSSDVYCDFPAAP